MMVPPFEIDDFAKLSTKEAKEHFNWYISQIPFRLQQLEKYLNEELKENIKFDFSPSSLLDIWKCFESYVKTDKKTNKEIKEELEKYPQWLHESILETDYKFTVESLVVGMDIAIYFAETIIRNNPVIKWGYFTKPKSRMSVNKPVLLGFQASQDLDPREIVLNCMRKSYENKQFDRLFNIYNIWVEEI